MSETEATPLPRRRMSLVAEQNVPDPPASPVASIESPPTPTRTPPELTQELMARAAWRQGVIGSLNVAAMVLGVRLTLLVAILGAISLTWLALQQQEMTRLIALGIYVVGTIPAVVWLAGRR